VTRERWCALAATALMAMASRDARAGRSGFAWFFDTEVVPERGVELETWVIDENGLGDQDRDTTRILWQPAIGVTERLELALPVELDHIEIDDPMVGGDTQLANYGAELRLRLASPDRIDAGPVVALLRLGGKRVVTARERVRGEGDLVVSAELGRCWRAVADAGVVGEAGTGTDLLFLRPGAGVNVLVAPDLRAGVEAFASFNLDDDRSTDWMVVGPNLAWTHGRFWLAATFGVGLFGIDTAPRINWAVAF
jgi:hypothetical protein